VQSVSVCYVCVWEYVCVSESVCVHVAAGGSTEAEHFVDSVLQKVSQKH